MKELDLLLLGFVDNSYPHATPEQQLAFRRLLSMPDPEIMALLTGRTQADDEHLAHVIRITSILLVLSVS